MNFVQGKKNIFIGVVKFYDKIKDFGFIVSNKCNMPPAIPQLSFYANSSSFTEEAAKKDECIVVFQVGIFRNGDMKAINVRCITDSDDDINLILDYYGNDEYIRCDRKDFNLYTYMPKHFVADKVKTIIANDKNRSPQNTVSHFKFFIEHYKQDVQSKDKYVFDKDFKTEEKIIWTSFFSIFTDEESLEILKLYPSAVRYYDNIGLLQKWIELYFSEECTIQRLEEIKNIIDSLPETCLLEAKERIEAIADMKIKEIYVKLSKRSDITENDFSFVGNSIYRHSYDYEVNQLLKDLQSYLNFTTKNYNEVQIQCLITVRNNKIKDELEKFKSEPSNTTVMNSFFDLVKSFSEEEINKYKKNIIRTVIPILDKYIDDKKYFKTVSLLQELSFLDDEFYSKYIKALHPLITIYLKESINSNLNSYYNIKNNFIYSFNNLTTIFKESDTLLIKQAIIPTIEQTESIAVLSLFSSYYSWISIDKALSLSNDIMNTWSCEHVKRILDPESELLSIDKPFKIIIIKRIIHLMSSISLRTFMDDINVGDLDENTINNNINTECQNHNFLIQLKDYIQEGGLGVEWENFVNSRNTDDLLVMYENKVLESLPDNAIVEIIKTITLENAYTHEEKCYDKPNIENKTWFKVLKSTSLELVPIIGKRLVDLDISNENIPLAVFLTELMSCNKPDAYDYESTQELRRWENRFKSQLTTLKNSTISNLRLSVILWAVHFQTSTSMTTFVDMFAYMPPYIQIRCVKKLFQLIDRGQIKHTAESLYKFISKGSKQICFPLEIVFSYLMSREKNPLTTLNDKMMLEMLNKRDDDHSEWVGIKHIMTECCGRWKIEDSDRKYNNYFNGLVENNNDGRLRMYIPRKMIDEYGCIQEYNNKYFQDIRKLIEITYTESDYQVKEETQDVSYFFEKSKEAELFAIAISFNLKFNSLDNDHVFCQTKGEDEILCECRLSNKLDNNYKIAFYWCKNKPCFRPPIRYKLNSEWEYYTILDFMRILKIPTDYTNKKGQKIIFGHYIILSAYLNSFTKFYEHLQCRACDKLIKPIDITNFAASAITVFSCTNGYCTEHKKKVYLNHCFNKQKCKSIIDSRDSQKCPNEQFICTECGACCSTENFRSRMDNLQETGGYISNWLMRFVRNDLGHWEKHEYFCYKCGNKLQDNNENNSNQKKCSQCNIEYKITN